MAVCLLSGEIAHPERFTFQDIILDGSVSYSEDTSGRP